jgi:hypothetical protein
LINFLLFLRARFFTLIHRILVYKLPKTENLIPWQEYETILQAPAFVTENLTPDKRSGSRKSLKAERNPVAISTFFKCWLIFSNYESSWATPTLDIHHILNSPNPSAVGLSILHT